MEINITLKTLEKTKEEIINSKEFFTINSISKKSGIHPYAIKVAFRELEKIKFIQRVNSSTRGQLYRKVKK